MFNKKALIIVSIALALSNGFLVAEGAKKRVPQEGYISNYGPIQNLWRLYNYASGHNRKSAILEAIKNNDKENFKRNFIEGDLVHQSDLVIEVIVNNKVELLKMVDEELNIDIKAVADSYAIKHKKSSHELPHALVERHGSDAIPMLHFLHQRGFALAEKDAKGNNIAHNALEKKDKQLYNELVENIIDTNVQNNDGDNLLHATARLHDSYYFAQALKKNSEFNAQNNQGETPAFIATKNSDSEKLKLLSNIGADVNIANNDGTTPGHIAASGACSAPVAKIIFESNMNPKAMDNKGVTVQKTLKNAMHRECIKKITKITNKKSFSEYKQRCNHLALIEHYFIQSRLQDLNQRTKKLKEEKNRLIELGVSLNRERLDQQAQQLENELELIKLEKHELEERRANEYAGPHDIDELQEVLTEELDQQKTNPTVAPTSDEKEKKHDDSH